MTTEIVSMRHVRAAKICAKGARGWWALQGWDYADFLVNGIAAEKLEATGDALALKVVACMRAEHG